MTITNDDFTFSSTTGGDPMKYGTGGDCTFAHGCLPRKGFFHIDTSNTGIIVDKTVCCAVASFSRQKNAYCICAFPLQQGGDKCL